MAWQIRLSVCRLWRACTLLRRFNFSGIFLHHIVAWPSGNSPTKNQEDRPRGSPRPRGLNRKAVVNQANSHVWLSHLLMSFLYTLRLCMEYEYRNQEFSCVTAFTFALKQCADFLLPSLATNIPTGVTYKSLRNHEPKYNVFSCAPYAPCVYATRNTVAYWPSSVAWVRR